MIEGPSTQQGDGSFLSYLRCVHMKMGAGGYADISGNVAIFTNKKKIVFIEAPLSLSRWPFRTRQENGRNNRSKNIFTKLFLIIHA